MLGAPVMGFIIDRTSLRTANVSLIFFTIIAWTLLILFILNKEWSGLVYPMLFCFGFNDTCINTLLNTILGFEFKSKTIPFGVYRVIRNPIIAIISAI